VTPTHSEVPIALVRYAGETQTLAVAERCLDSAALALLDTLEMTCGCVDHSGLDLAQSGDRCPVGIFRIANDVARRTFPAMTSWKRPAGRGNFLD